MNISLADFFSNAQLNNENIDEYSLQLIAQVNNCTDEEKR
jgi:hypothetical protein